MKSSRGAIDNRTLIVGLVIFVVIASILIWRSSAEPNPNAQRALNIGDTLKLDHRNLPKDQTPATEDNSDPTN